MTEKKTKTKEKKFIKVDDVDQKEPKKVTRTTKAERREKATGKRVAAVIFWLLGIACEIVAILLLCRKLYVTDDKLLMWVLIAFAADLVFIIIGSQFWKRANDVDPASEENKVKFWLWNQMGLIAACLAFLPVIIVLLLNKQLDGKTKKIATAAAVVGLLVAGLVSFDYDPISAEEREAAETTFEGEAIYWTQWGKKYHLYEDCQAFHGSENIFVGTIESAMDAGRTSLCAFCEKRLHDGN